MTEAGNYELHTRTGVVLNGLLASLSPIPREFCRYLTKPNEHRIH